MDIDLSSFALPWPAFRRDCQALREEFAHLSGRSFYTAQLKFHQSLLAGSNLYFTAFFRERLERTAVQNIRRYMEEASAEDDS